MDDGAWWATVLRATKKQTGRSKHARQERWHRKLDDGAAGNADRRSPRSNQRYPRATARASDPGATPNIPAFKGFTIAKRAQARKGRRSCSHMASYQQRQTWIPSSLSPSVHHVPLFATTGKTTVLYLKPDLNGSV